MSTIPDQAPAIQALRDYHNSAKRAASREEYLLASALDIAIKRSESQPDHLRRRSDENDMRQMLKERFAVFKTAIDSEEVYSTELGS